MTRKTTKLTVTDVADRLEQAANTLKKLPPVRVQGMKSFWPQIIYSANEAYGWEPARYGRFVPKAKEIDEMEEALSWLLWLPAEQSKLVFARAEGKRWKELVFMFGKTRQALSQKWMISIMTIQIRLVYGEKDPLRRYKRNAC